MYVIHFLSVSAVSICKALNIVYVQTGGSVQLDIQTDEVPHFNTLIWINDKSENIVIYTRKTKDTIFNKHSVIFNQSTFSLTLKNMQRTDSGLYTAKIFGTQNEDLVKYNVSVIDAVDSPVLNRNFTMISVNSCIVDVSCSAHTLQLNKRYYSDNCSQEEMTSYEIQTLTLYCIENVVVCSYSNPVSLMNATIELNQLCTSHQESNNSNSTSPLQPPEKDQHSSFPLHWLLVIAAGVAVLVSVAVSVTFCSYQRRTKEVQVIDHTVYAQVKPKNKVKRPQMLEKSENPQTVYGLTGEHKQTHNTSQTITTHEAKTTMENSPCTTYSTIGEHQTPALPTESENTIYSVVTEPKCGRPPVHK
ncbi:uncharacterized protein LOC130237219 [Danio aesculapii]|uniref:uncharacterized protein LOC130237219 n=1 Tax=Danio aesculapii TaxID=1142201 RepID=UPI0024C0AE12|nr:uncharacterized protein LOC130237219 [Danio aesculapii]